MEGKWTYADLSEKVWEHEAFDSKEEAIHDAQQVYDEGCHVGQLHQPYYESSKYKVINQEKVMFD